MQLICIEGSAWAAKYRKGQVGVVCWPKVEPFVNDQRTSELFPCVKNTLHIRFLEPSLLFLHLTFDISFPFGL